MKKRKLVKPKVEMLPGPEATHEKWQMETRMEIMELWPHPSILLRFVRSFKEGYTPENKERRKKLILCAQPTVMREYFPRNYAKTKLI